MSRASSAGCSACPPKGMWGPIPQPVTPQLKEKVAVKSNEDESSQNRKSTGKLAMGLGIGVGLALLATYGGRRRPLIHTRTSADAVKTKPAVLVIEDEAGPRDALRVILQPFFDIYAVDNGRAALQMLRERPIDLITLDQKLPDRQGLDLLQDIKHDHADVEVIIITGYGSLKSAMEGLRHGATGYLLKPFNVTELIALMNQTLEKKQRLDFLRAFLRRSKALWGTDRKSATAWKELRTHYCSIGKPASDTAPAPSDAELLTLLSDLLEAKDRQLLNHGSRVSFYATLPANRLNLTMAEEKSLTLGAFLHDMGKIGIEGYDFCRDQAGGLGETMSFKQHPDVGARMAGRLGLPAEVGQIIACHHERYDGSGYPHGLHGVEIPLLARIVSIAQVFDHLTVEVPGRSPVAVDDALRQISLQAGTHFDPTLTDIFTRAVTECKESLPAMAIAA